MAPTADGAQRARFAFLLAGLDAVTAALDEGRIPGLTDAQGAGKVARMAADANRLRVEPVDGAEHFARRTLPRLAELAGCEVDVSLVVFPEVVG